MNKQSEEVEKVPYSRVENFRSFIKKIPAMVPLVTLLLFVIFAQTIFQQRQEIRSGAAMTECVYMFNSSSTCSSYCARQPGKTCQQNSQQRWGCCSSNTATITTTTNEPIKCSIRSGQPQIPCPTGYTCVNTCNPAPGMTGCAQYDICKLNPTPTSTNGKTVYCVQDVQKCPDGSYVRRIPPACQFAPCLKTTTSTKALPTPTPTLIPFKTNKDLNIYALQASISGSAVKLSAIPYYSPNPKQLLFIMFFIKKTGTDESIKTSDWRSVLSGSTIVVDYFKSLSAGTYNYTARIITKINNESYDMPGVAFLPPYPDYLKVFAPYKTFTIR